MKRHQQLRMNDLETFLTDLRHVVNPDTIRKVPASDNQEAHPAPETFERYVAGELRDQEARRVMAHLAVCPACNHNALYLMRMTCDPVSESTMRDDLARYIDDWRSKISAAFEHVSFWATELWQPTFAGTPVMASNIPPQHHTFSGREGEIEITCAWRPEHGTSPAYLQLSWLANLHVERELRAVFFNPDTKALLAEIPLGSYLEGGKNLTSRALGFNPSSDTWAVAILVKEKSA